MKMKRTKRVLFLLPSLVILIGFTYLPLIIGLICLGGMDKILLLWGWIII